jgi:hypothetical protein
MLLRRVLYFAKDSAGNHRLIVIQEHSPVLPERAHRVVDLGLESPSACAPPWDCTTWIRTFTFSRHATFPCGKLLRSHKASNLSLSGPPTPLIPWSYTRSQTSSLNQLDRPKTHESTISSSTCLSTKSFGGSAIRFLYA